MAAIEVNGLTRYYGETRGVEEITFDVREGEIFGVLGPNGAGKTTTIRTLMGLQSPTSGEATVLGHDIMSGRDVREMKQKIGYIPRDPAFDKDITGRQLLAYHASFKDDDRREPLVDLFDVPVDRSISEYSRENTQKLAIVLAFMHDPALVIMDEPTLGLDPLAKERFYGFISREKEHGTTILLSTPVLSETCKVCDRVGILRNGHLTALEDVETLLDRAGKSIRVQIAERDVSDFALDGAHDIEIVDEMGSSHSVDGEQADGGTEQMDEISGDGESESVTEITETTETTQTTEITQTTQHGTTIQFIYTGEYNALFEQLLDYTVIDIDLSEAPLETVLTRFYGARLGTGTDGGDNNA
jgi:ABC-2 type transport system ATP-binding protein